MDAQIDEVISRALDEDHISEDVTTRALISDAWQGRGPFLIKASGVLAGIEVARRVFLKVDPDIRMEILFPDGTHVKPGDIVAIVSGKLSVILRAERAALNFLQHLSGVATATSQLVEAVKGLPVKILDTRKTLPGLRVLEKYAVRMGGGQNHRMHLGDAILIKDNHIAFLTRQGLDIKGIIALARRKSPAALKLEIEVKTPAEALQAAEAGPGIILLDNMKPDAIRESVKLIKGRALIEASGGINLTNVRQVAECGVDFISSGAITHSVRALDISLELEME